MNTPSLLSNNPVKPRILVVKRMVEAMHGRVWCESEHGCGASFNVNVPAA